MEKKTVNLEDVLKLIDKISDRYSSGAYTNAARSIRKEIVTDLQSLPSESKEAWIGVDERLPHVPDEDYMIAVRNKNKYGGIWLIDIANYNSDGQWLRNNTWEDVLYWSLKPSPPTK